LIRRRLSECPATVRWIELLSILALSASMELEMKTLMASERNQRLVLNHPSIRQWLLELPSRLLLSSL
jgi:hypothetical protein